ncbi:MAG: hypothetical protein C0599_18520 [Salinivirgaceae bacterium]|nr:MAG: hypothetical protein C0599_18520 [Salinivirgaceae bacterium]
MKRLFIILALLIPLLSYSQVNKYGAPFYRYYGMEEYGGTEQNWAIVKDSRGLLYVGNNDKGVLQYDGKNWRQIPVSNNSIVRSLAADDNGVVYVGAVGEFGRLLPDERGFLTYKSLLHKLDSTYHKYITDIWKTYTSDSIIYFCAEKVICEYHKNKDTISTFKLPKYSFFSHLVDDQIYASHYYQGLSKHIQDTTFEFLDSVRLNKANVFVMDKLNDSVAVLGTVARGLFKLDLENFKLNDPDCIEASNYLKNNLLYQADITPDYSAFATLNGGVLVTKEMKPFEIYGEKNGLPKDERVAYVYADSSIKSPLWAALNNGIIRIDWHLPFRVMDERNGLSGHVSDIKRFNGKLYVATSSGLFVLNYDEKGPVFEQISRLEQQIWNLYIYTYPQTGKEVLLVGTIRGLYELNTKGQVSEVEKKVDGIEEGNEYYVYVIDVPNEEKPNEIVIGTRQGAKYLTVVDENHWKEKEVKFNSEVRTIAYGHGGYWFGTTYNGIAYKANDVDTVKFYGQKAGFKSLDQNFVSNVNGNIAVINSFGIYIYDSNSDKFEFDEKLGKIARETKMGISKMVKDHTHFYLNMYNKDHQKIRRINIDGNYTEHDTALFNRLPNVQFDVVYPDGDIIWLGSSKGLFVYVKSMDKGVPGKNFKTLIRSVSIQGDSILIGGAYEQMGQIVSAQPEQNLIRLSYSENDIEFEFAAPFFEREDEIVYSYMLEGYEDEWSPWSTKTEEDSNNLPAGDYTFKVKAKNIYGFESEEKAYSVNFSGDSIFGFRIMPPWYATIWAIIGYFILLVLLVRFIVQWRTRKLKLEKERLERIVEERTAEIMEKKDEIEKQRDEIAEKNQSITDSIHYASRIQQALLPSTQMFEENVPEHFVLFKPRDIVSGDYYWMTRIEQKVILVAADCTGHGVPGAFMSMLGMSFLNEIVNKNITTDAGEILNQLRAHVIDALKQEGDDVKAKDGMDLALYVIDRENGTINFAGANNPLYIIRELTEEEKQAIKDGDESKLPKRPVYDDTHILQEIKADKMPIGIHIKNQPFETKVVPIQKGMQLYTFSDGFVDQFGGPKRRKFMSKSFKHLLMKIYKKPMQEQRQILDETIIKWIEEGNEIQVDDIIVLGVRIVK